MTPTLSAYDQRWIERAKARSVESASGCWLWQGFIGPWGYGRLHYRGRGAAVHRKMYEIEHGVTLTRWQLVCHTCDVPNCWNPEHLWLGTPSDNILDSAKKGRHRNARKTECKHGHPLSGANVWICKEGLRHCRTCSRIRQRIAGGWTREEALADITPIPQNAPTPRRWKGKAA
jgi:hypothetical protein